jgi:gas vesicle protein
MKRIKALLVGLACCGALTVSAAALTFAPQNSNQNSAACCDMENCCKDAAMSCCKKKSKNGKNAHACCKGKDGAGESCCCKGDSCPMPNKKASNTNTN